jgi:hypothetical protein
MTYEEFVANKHSTRMEAADSVLPDLLEATANSRDTEITAARKVLSAWDRQTEAQSRGAVLFEMFFNDYFGPAGSIADRLRVHFDPKDFVNSAHGLADREAAVASLKRAAAACQQLYGRLDIEWGEVYRFASGTADCSGERRDRQVGCFPNPHLRAEAEWACLCRPWRNICLRDRIRESPKSRVRVELWKFEPARIEASRGSTPAHDAEEAASRIAGP